MGKKLQESMDRASALLKTPKEYEKYISIKLSPPSGCCCSDCWPKTWQEINQAIAPCGSVRHEGDALIEVNENKFVLESHESGPEIIVYLALVTASATLTKAIIDLIITIIKGLSNEDRKQPPRIKISKKRIIKGEIQEENLIEINIPISKDMQKQLEEKIKQSINRGPK
jgi:hypothetical protein